MQVQTHESEFRGGTGFGGLCKDILFCFAQIVYLRLQRGDPAFPEFLIPKDHQGQFDL
jgi:hypothetical protein